jgi:hypothetical protein
MKIKCTQWSSTIQPIPTKQTSISHLTVPHDGTVAVHFILSPPFVIMYMYDLSDFATIQWYILFRHLKCYFTINHTFKSEDSTTKTDLNFNRIVYIIYLPLSASVLSFCFQQIQIKQNEVSYIEYILYTFATNCCNEESLVSEKSNVNNAWDLLQMDVKTNRTSLVNLNNKNVNSKLSTHGGAFLK